MRKRHSERINRSFFYLLVLNIILILTLTTDVSAQGGDGRSGTAKKPSSESVSRKRVRQHAPKPRIVPVAPAIPPIETGRLAILVNEGGSQVLLSQSGGVGNAESISVTSRASSLILRTLPVGSYTLLVKKPGFFDETRNVYIAADKRRRVVITMRPQMALLTVKTNLVDAEIDIEKVGKFNGSLRKHFVKPGLYRITVQRRGYVSQTITADLKLRGREQHINVVLQSLRIDSVLAQANENINNGSFTSAAELANDVLLLNAKHAKANLLYGLIEFNRGNLSASTYFLKAIKNGETVSLPVKVREENGVTRLVAVELRLNRDGLSIRSTSRFDLNFTIPRSNISELRRSIDPAFMTYIEVKGKSNFHGRPIGPHLMIYSGGSALRADPKQVYCQASAAGRSCSTDIDILYKVISEWRDSKDTPERSAALVP